MMPLWTMAMRPEQSRVGVLVGGRAVGGPAGVGDAGGAHEVGRLAALVQHGHATGALDAMEFAVSGEDLDAGGVIPAVLKRL